MVDLKANVDAARAKFSIVQGELPLLGLREISVVLDDMTLAKGIERALRAKLGAIERSVLRGNNNAALGQVGAFERLVEAQEAKKLTAEEAVLLKALACNLRNQIKES